MTMMRILVGSMALIFFRPEQNGDRFDRQNAHTMNVVTSLDHIFHVYTSVHLQTSSIIIESLPQWLPIIVSGVIFGPLCIGFFILVGHSEQTKSKNPMNAHAIDSRTRRVTFVSISYTIYLLCVCIQSHSYKCAMDDAQVRPCKLIWCTWTNKSTRTQTQSNPTIVVLIFFVYFFFFIWYPLEMMRDQQQQWNLKKKTK